ncbi:MAG: hypothetical protein IMZ64_07680 [Bacteroidetes bacterium]|nr:hypothetical protein [Bacteroidota bacterium]
MDSNKKTAIISTLWIIVMLNMAFADILTLVLPAVASSFPITQVIMLGFAIILEIPIVMIILSRVLKDKVNRWVNTIASVITIAFVTVGGLLTPHYIFFAAMEIVCMAIIVWLVWKRS